MLFPWGGQCARTAQVAGSLRRLDRVQMGLFPSIVGPYLGVSNKGTQNIRGHKGDPCCCKTRVILHRPTRRMLCRPVYWLPTVSGPLACECSESWVAAKEFQLHSAKLTLNLEGGCQREQ